MILEILIALIITKLLIIITRNDNNNTNNNIIIIKHINNAGLCYVAIQWTLHVNG